MGFTQPTAYAAKKSDNNQTILSLVGGLEQNLALKSGKWHPRPRPSKMLLFLKNCERFFYVLYVCVQKIETKKIIKWKWKSLTCHEKDQIPHHLMQF